jgi:hypothetical protein
MPVVDTGNRPPLWLSLGLAGACVLALADWPYGYYQLLRVAVTAYATWIAWQAFEGSRTTWAWTFAFLGILYNPFIKIALDRDTWGFVNLATAAIIAAEFWGFRQLSASEKSDTQS